MIIAHFRKLRKHEFLSGALGVVIIEANNSTTAIDIVEDMKRTGEPGITFLKEAKGMGIAKTQPGLVTTSNTKDRMVSLMMKYLKEKRIVFAEDFVWAKPGFNSQIQDLKGEFEKEMRKFSKKKIVTRDHKNDIDKVHYTYSGKCIKENDDLPMATMLALLGKELFFSSENRVKYGVYW